jgi:creatinine amidohydrolase
VSALLGDLAWPDVAERARADALLAVPLGSTEQHGPHLPLSTDTDVASALCARLAAARADVVLAPAVPYGSSGEHAGFAGTLSIGQDATELLVLELGRSACETFRHVLFVSAHGGNSDPVTRATDQLCLEGRDVSLFEPNGYRDPHAGHAETSLQLALDPGRARMDRAVAGETRPLPELLPRLRAGGVRAVTDTGVLGDPRAASVADGAELLADLTAALCEHVARWRDGR